MNLNRYYSILVIMMKILMVIGVIIGSSQTILGCNLTGAGLLLLYEGILYYKCYSKINKGRVFILFF